jgi:peroxiredoxin
MASSPSRWITSLAAAAALGAAGVAQATLHPGDRAPDFSAQGSLGGKVFGFSLAKALQQGPVVLYFYPAAFTTGCTVEAHEFAEATDKFKALGATVVGVSHDDIGTLNRFSTSECRSKFAVLADTDQHIMKAYDAVLAVQPKYADRVSYLIAPSGRVIAEYGSLNPYRHVAEMMEALQAWKAQQPGSPASGVIAR